MRTAEDEHALDKAQEQLRKADENLIRVAYEYADYPFSATTRTMMIEAVDAHQRAWNEYLDESNRLAADILERHGAP